MLTLQYPTISPSITTVLRNAELSNRFRFAQNKAVRRVRGGDVKIALGDWVETRTRLFEVRALTYDEIKDFREFLTVTAGLIVRITLWDSTYYDGVILTPAVEMVTVRDQCSYDVSFEFMEELVLT